MIVDGLVYVPKVGEKVHLSSMGGIFTIAKVDGDKMIITTNKWKKDYSQGMRSDPPFKMLSISDIKCLAGGEYSKGRDLTLIRTTMFAEAKVDKFHITVTNEAGCFDYPQNMPIPRIGETVILTVAGTTHTGIVRDIRHIVSGNLSVVNITIS